MDDYLGFIPYPDPDTERQMICFECRRESGGMVDCNKCNLTCVDNCEQCDSKCGGV
ncbi:MAG: hypothetical protein GY853_16620 [PVC group bacterium]|nr:hypothetical protein [PVC group bacterium]